MKIHSLGVLLCLILLLPPLVIGSDRFGSDSTQLISASTSASQLVDSRAPSRAGARSLKSLSSPLEDSTELVALLNGTIYLEDANSGRVFWSFSSGAPIYSSYQAPFDQDNGNENDFGASTGFFVDYGDDWQLYVHGKHSSGMKLSMNIEEFIKITPHVSEDGAVILGSKTTTVFVVEAKTGKLVQTYNSFDSPSTLKRDEESYALLKENKKNGDLIISESASAAQLMYITRKDYTLQTFGPNSDKISWNMKVAMIGAASICRDVESRSDYNMPLSCQSRWMVVRRQHKSQSADEKLPLPDSDPVLPSQPRVDKLLEDQHEGRRLSEFAADPVLPLQPKVDEFPNSHTTDNSEGIFDLSTDSGAVDARVAFDDGLNILIKRSTAFSFMFFIVVFLLGFIFYPNDQVGKDKLCSEGLSSVSSSKASSSKRKKNRKSSKKNGIVETKDAVALLENGDGYAHSDGDEKMLLDLNKHVDNSIDGHRIGKLFVSNTEIAKGSNGTIVLEGIYEGRPVAVKRLVQSHHEAAFKEIQNLIASDRHPNIVRWHGVEYDKDFVYVSLERCTCSLDDLIQIFSDFSLNQVYSEDQATRVAIEYKVRLDKVKGIMQDINLWKSNGRPSPLMLVLMRNIVCGLVHLHELGIIHRDLKPQNVLILKDRFLCAKLSDMGISKRLLGDMSSLGYHATGCGSSGWQSPEQLLHGRQTRAVDLFSLGCVLFFCITGGRHPFGERLERDINIVKNKKDLFLIEYFPEAEDLISRLLNHDPNLRPKSLDVLHHPIFWNSEMRLSFLRDTSDRVELEDRESSSDLLKALENIAPTALGGKWDERMEPAFIANIGHYRRYKYDSVRDLLRVLRNKLNHYRELPKEIQELVGPVPEGYDSYYTSRFPKLLIEVYKVVSRFCREEDCFHKYFNGIVV
ncbi:serine/threonine-protein kinase/endoribonuclease IRE1a [Mercurialis annua]|uniref:serine/threonine-protein kinase/endoribonuclease IRE1a n=1 Tax=Mercurialis annua TaxID=3986 RepID=UPI00215FCF0A|nr:serine/threonine-protein kinase/endoribonuclease IRE1a [Mercurialis annua]